MYTAIDSKIDEQLTNIKIFYMHTSFMSDFVILMEWDWLTNRVPT